MGLGSLLGLATKLFSSTGPSQSTIQRAGVEEKPAALEQVNAAVHETELNQLHAAEKQPVTTQAIKPEIITSPAVALATTDQQETKPSAIKLEISQKTVDDLKPMLLKAVNGLKAILPFIEAGIKTILPKSEVDEIFSNIIKNNGGREKAMQWLETHVKNNPILARANTPNPTANPAQ